MTGYIITKRLCNWRFKRFYMYKNKNNKTITNIPQTFKISNLIVKDALSRRRKRKSFNYICTNNVNIFSSTEGILFNHHNCR